MKTRPYRMQARAQAAAETERRIFAAARELVGERRFEQITLDQVASRAGVSVQTVIRRYGSKDGLIRAVADAASREVEAQRFAAPVGDVKGIVANLIEHYEATGDEGFRLQCQEEGVPLLQEVLGRARAVHAEWVERVFAPWLEPLSGAERRRRHAELVAVCDLLVWKLLRRDLGLSRSQTQRAIREMIEGVIG